MRTTHETSLLKAGCEVESAEKVERVRQLLKDGDFDDSLVCFFEFGNPDALAKTTLGILRDGDLRRRMVARASEYAARNNWQSRKVDYLKIVDSLCSAEHQRA
ncbi:MAG: hypothetical protein HZC54_08115 [Verrucomicrobia bacterium]|nr:hypothetical protein [Verrucomicrobiota bacterium]